MATAPDNPTTIRSKDGRPVAMLFEIDDNAIPDDGAILLHVLDQTGHTRAEVVIPPDRQPRIHIFAPDGKEWAQMEFEDDCLRIYGAGEQIVECQWDDEAILLAAYAPAPDEDDGDEDEELDDEYDDDGEDFDDLEDDEDWEEGEEDGEDDEGWE